MNDWVEQNRARIDKIKAGGVADAHAMHTKGMLAAETALYAMYELFTSRANGETKSQDARTASAALEMFYNLKTHHVRADNAAYDMIGMPVARSGER